MAILSESINGTVIDINIGSTNLKSASYNTETKVLKIIFNNNNIYEYSDVPWEIFTKFRMSESQGKYFNVNIARKYTYKKIDEQKKNS
jgi:hypothetical protein